MYHIQTHFTFTPKKEAELFFESFVFTEKYTQRYRSKDCKLENTFQIFVLLGYKAALIGS
jgi:hypothetical protein